MSAHDAHSAAIDYLIGRINYERASDPPYGERELKLARMNRLLSLLGDPHEGMPIVHIAGTKGKGSTAAMVASVLSAAGHRTGLFTSPHLERLEERWVVDGRPCSPDEVVAMFDTLRPAVEQMDREAAGDPQGQPTYFELVTALALLHFRGRQVDWAVLEVGLGGRLDSTNVCTPRVAAITSISYDHTRQLGSTLEQIASEKAGIIKPGVPTVVGQMEPAPLNVIARICRDRGAPLAQAGIDFKYEYLPPRHVERAPAHGRLSYVGRWGKRTHQYDELTLALLGDHQASNAAVAIAILSELKVQGIAISEAALRRGLAELNCPARIEVWRRCPTVVFDTAHNVASVQATLRTLKESFHAACRRLVFATARDKDTEGMLAALLPCFDEVYFTRYGSNPRAAAAEDLCATARRLAPSLGCSPEMTVCSDVAAAWQQVVRRTRATDLVCCTGSFFLAAELRHEAQRNPLCEPVVRESA